LAFQKGEIQDLGVSRPQTGFLGVSCVTSAMGFGTFEVGESSSQPNNTTRARDELLYIAMNLGKPREKAIKNSDSK
jgi:hypothetical protein